MKSKREIGILGAIVSGLSGAIGFEIFVLTDYAYFTLARSGTALVSALLLGGLINLIIMLSYCELAAAIPEVGGEYTYIQHAYGGIVAFISGCLRWFASVFGAALAALAFSQQFAYLFLRVPVVYNFISTQLTIIGVITVIVLAALNVKGAKKAGTVIVVVFLAIFGIFITCGLWRGLTPLEEFPQLLPEGLPRVFAATAYIFPMLFGMRALVASAALIKNPEKNIPRSILLSALLIIPIYVGLVYIAAGVVSLEGAHPSAPFLNFAAEKIMGVAGGILFAIAGMVASLSALGTSIYVQSSIARGMSRDGYLPEVLQSVHRRFGTHHVAIITGSIFIVLLSAVGTVAFLGYAASFGSLLVFALVNLSLMKLRKKIPEHKRPFNAPLYPITPVAGIIMSLLLLVFPLFLGDVNAESALTGSLGLTVLVLMIYYLKMIRRDRLRIAVGGVSLGIGISTALVAFLIETGSGSAILIFVSVISIIAGILNVTARTPKIF